MIVFIRWFLWTLYQSLHKIAIIRNCPLNCKSSFLLFSIGWSMMVVMMMTSIMMSRRLLLRISSPFIYIDHIASSASFDLLWYGSRSFRKAHTNRCVQFHSASPVRFISPLDSVSSIKVFINVVLIFLLRVVLTTLYTHFISSFHYSGSFFVIMTPRMQQLCNCIIRIVY